MVRKGHLTGLKPMALVSFQSAVNFYRWKIEHLQIQMEAAPFRSKGMGAGAELEGPGGAGRAGWGWQGRWGRVGHPRGGVEGSSPSWHCLSAPIPLPQSRAPQSKCAV